MTSRTYTSNLVTATCSAKYNVSDIKILSYTIHHVNPRLNRYTRTLVANIKCSKLIARTYWIINLVTFDPIIVQTIISNVRTIYQYRDRVSEHQTQHTMCLAFDGWAWRSMSQLVYCQWYIQARSFITHWEQLWQYFLTSWLAHVFICVFKLSIVLSTLTYYQYPCQLKTN